MAGNFSQVDLLSFSGHKIHAPKGVGVLYIRRGTPLRPFLFGGHQESGRRGGTENVPYIVGIAKAMDQAAAPNEEDIARIERLRNRLEEGITAQIPYIEVNGKGAPRMPNTLNIACHAIEGEGILYSLNEYKICASSGSACTSGSLDPSHVLLAIGRVHDVAHGSLRLSLGEDITDEDADYIVKSVKEVVEYLRGFSPVWRDLVAGKGTFIL